MAAYKLDAYQLLEKIKAQRPLVHHLTNWVTIYDCANVVKVLGGSPVMAHASEEVAEMTGMASALVLNIGTLTVDFVESMKIAAKSANKKGIPVILDVCGAGATQLRDRKCFELLDSAHIAIIKGNPSEIARVSGKAVKTRGVDAGQVNADLLEIGTHLSRKYGSTVVVTGKIDIVTDGKKCVKIKNGHALMAEIVGTGCMSSSVVGAFAAVERDYVRAAAAGLVCFEIAAELAARRAGGPGTFKEFLLDALYHLDKATIVKMQKYV